VLVGLLMTVGHNKLLRSLIREIINDRAFAKGFGVLQVDRDDDNWWLSAADRGSDAEDDDADAALHEPINQARGADNRRTRIGSV